MTDAPDGGTGRPTPRPRPGPRPASSPPSAPSVEDEVSPPEVAAPSAPAARPSSPRRRMPALVLVLALLCVAAAAGVGLLLWQRQKPGHVDASIFAATRSGIEAVYAYDYRDSEASVQGKLDVLTGELRDEYERDLEQGGIIDTYEQVSATTRYEVLDVGLQQVNRAQDTATLIVFGQYVVESVNSGTPPAAEGPECQVMRGGAQSCTQTVRVTVVDVDGDWRISGLTLLTTS